jgi:hypothetical protein
MDGRCIPQEDCGHLVVTFQTYASCSLDVMAGQELDGEAKCPDAECKQERHKADEARDPAPEPLHPVNPGNHSGSPEMVLHPWTRPGMSAFRRVTARSSA